MRPSIAAALSTLGEVHNASEVLLRPDDAAKFNSVSYPGAAVIKPTAIVRPDGSLLLVVTFGPPSCPDATCIVGAVEPAAWTWADPSKRASKGERVRRMEPSFYAVMSPPITVTFDDLYQAGARGYAGRSPKDGDTLGSFTAAELDALPVGAKFELPGYTPVERTGIGWCKGSIEPYTLDVGKGDFADRTLVLPKPAPKPAPKVGDRWGDLDADQRAALPVGTVLGEAYAQLGLLWKTPNGWADQAGCVLTSLLNPARTIAYLPTVTA